MTLRNGVPQTMSEKLEELILKTTDSDNKEELDNILKLLENEKVTDNIKEALSLLIDSWQENPEKQPNKAFFITELPKVFKEDDFPVLRTALTLAIKNFLPVNINKTTAIKALGIRNKEIPLSKVYTRYTYLNKLRKGQIFHNNLSKIWGVTGDIDWIVGTISLFNFNGTFAQDIELETFFDNSSLFMNSEEIKKLQKIKNVPKKNEIIAILRENSLIALESHKIKNILLELLVPGFFSFDEFNSWYRKENTAAPSGLEKINPQSARSIHELHNILSPREASAEIFTKEVKENLFNILNLIKPSSTLKEYLLWAECICLLIDHYTKEEINLLTPASEQIRNIVWPEKIEENNEICIGIWTRLKALSLPSWIRYTEEVKSMEYLKQILNSLPWKVWPILSSKLSTTFIESTIEEANKISSPEMLLWMWKNKTKINREVLHKLNYSVVIPAIYKTKTGVLWQTAPKELKKLLLENPEFQKFILKDESENGIIALLEFLNNIQVLTLHDRQTLIVKLSRLSNKIRTILQSEKAKILIASKQQKTEDSVKDETYITSFKSYNEKIAELQDVITRQIPENTEAIATARAHGDLRENAEFAAAKERQKFLNEYRILLESKIAKTRPTGFSEIQVGNTVIVGSAIVVEYEDKSSEIFHILGAWDSNPAKKYISYETDLGQAIIGKQINDVVTLPGNKTCRIIKIEPLSQDIINELKG